MDRSRVVILTILCASGIAVTMDNTIVNVALPTLRVELGASITSLQWVVDAYIVLACFFLLAGATGDRFGRKKVFQVGLVVFGAGSLLCSFTPSVGWLITARMVQAIGGSMLNPVSMSILTNVFTDRAQRAKVMGIWGSVAGVSLGLGPVLGGILTDAIGWRAIFWVNVPVVVVVSLLTRRFVPESHAAQPRPADPVGQALVIVALGALIATVIEAPRLGVHSPAIISLALLAVVAIAFLVGWERRCAQPLIEMRFFRSVPFTAGALSAVFGIGAFGGFLFLSTIYLQNLRHLSPLSAGLILLPASIAAVVAAPLTGRLIAVHGSRWPLFAAGVAMAGVAAALEFMGPGASVGLLLGAFAVFGMGFGLLNPPITNTMMNGMPAEQAGVASGLVSTTRQIGQSLGVAVAGSVVATTAGGAIELSAGWVVVAVGGAAVALLALAATTRRAQVSAERITRAPAAPPVHAARSVGTIRSR